MTQTRGPTRWATLPLAAAALVALGAPVRAAVKVVPGQEFLYSGTAEWKVASTGKPAETMAGPVKVSALVTEADPVKGYAVILLRSSQPEAKAGEPKAAAEAALETVRYGADLTPTTPPDPPTGPMGLVLQVLRVPFTPRAELKTDQEWRQSESLPGVPLQPVEIVYHVAGDTRVGGRSGTRIEKKLAQPLPLKQDLNGRSLALTDYSQTICVDPETGQVLSNQLHEEAQVSAGPQQVTLDLSAEVTLQETRQLPEAELASRIKQAAAIEQVRRTLIAFRPDNKGALAETSKSAAAFRREFPNSPYAPVLAQLDAIRGQMQAQVDRETRIQGLKGVPAPAFALKSLAGKEQTLAAYRGKIVLLNFFASWCGPCNAEAPELQKAFWEKYRHRGVVVLGVDTGEQGDQARLARQFRDQHGLTYPILLDAGDRVAQKYGVTAFPTSLIIDGKGIVRQTVVGYDAPGLERAIGRLLPAK